MVTAVDSSGNGNDGTYSGIVGAAGRPGLVTGDPAVFFGDGPNRVADVLTPVLVDWTTPFTIACLFATPGPSVSFLMYLADSGGPNVSFSLLGDTLIVSNGSLEWDSDSGAVPVDGLPHLLAFTYDDAFPTNTGVFYVDGVEIPNAIVPIDAIPETPMTSAGINGDTADAAGGSGTCDEWACWNRVLSGGEIASLQAARGSFAAYAAAVLALSPTAYYHFDELPPLGGWSVGMVAMAAS